MEILYEIQIFLTTNYLEIHSKMQKKHAIITYLVQPLSEPSLTLKPFYIF